MLKGSWEGSEKVKGQVAPTPIVYSLFRPPSEWRKQSMKAASPPYHLRLCDLSHGKETRSLPSLPRGTVLRLRCVLNECPLSSAHCMLLLEGGGCRILPSNSRQGPCFY